MGFLTCASLIVAIGAQTSFVLRQGILRSHIFLTAVTCLICDAVLICAGISVFPRPKAWAAFDFGIALVMWWLALGLAGRMV